MGSSATSESVADGTDVAGCPASVGGIVTVPTSGGNITGCNTIMGSVEDMINTAWAQNPPIKLSGGGFRTKQGQINTRIANCGGNTTYHIYEKPSSHCSPPTAIPGTSRHERGVAFDLNCDGALIRDKSNHCFVWLSANAGTYKLKNFPKEPWHWSVDGK
jgi:hypothetical protein